MYFISYVSSTLFIYDITSALEAFRVLINNLCSTFPLDLNYSIHDSHFIYDISQKILVVFVLVIFFIAICVCIFISVTAVSE